MNILKHLILMLSNYYKNKIYVLFLLFKGVKLKCLSSVFIDKTVTFSYKNVIIEDNVTIKGISSVASNVSILKGSYIVDASIGENSVIGPYVYINGSFIGGNNKVGPFAYIRPGTKSAINVKIGAFVETKNMLIDENSKVPHLSYIGDASIGKNVNVGAGVITCNYDGLKKSKTVIGDNVFIGSDVQLIAPIDIASNVYIAAGSTINKNVDEFELAIARSKQENKADYVKKLRGKKCVE